MKIYTRTGDKGQTSLASGTRVNKNHERVVAYGEIDALNSWVGLLVASIKKSDISRRDSLSSVLTKIQNQLFAVGSEIAFDDNKGQASIKSPIEKEHIDLLEKKMDEYDQELSPLKNFILPGGSEHAAMAHICRTQARTAERATLSIKDLRQELRSYVNRLSDFFFVLARYLLSLIHI